MSCLTSNTYIAGIRKMTSHSARNSIPLTSSFGRTFWTALSAVSCLGLVFPRYSYCSSAIFVSKVEPAQFGYPLAWLLRIYSDLARPWSDSVDRQCNSSDVSSGDYWELSSLWAVLRSGSCCAFAQLCVDAGRFMHFLYDGTILVDHDVSRLFF